MALEEDLQRTLETATARLKDDVARELQAIVLDVVAQLRSERETRARGVSVLPEAAGLPEWAQLVEAVRALDRAASLSEILDTLVTTTRSVAPRVGLLLAARGELRGWRLVGFGSSDDGASSVALALDDSGVLCEAIRNRSAAMVDPTSARLSPPPFAAPCAEGLAVPIAVGSEVVGVLYADLGGAPKRAAGSTWVYAIEVLARYAARCLEARTAFNAARVLAEQQPARSSSSASEARERAAQALELSS